MRRIEKKDYERYYLDPFVHLLGLKPSRIVPHDPPDFMLTVCGREIAVELTEFYSEADDVPDIGLVRAWQRLRQAIGEERNRHTELHDVDARIVFRDQRLPPSRDHGRFAEALVHFVLAQMPGYKGQERVYARDTLATVPMLGNYLEQLEIEHAGCYCTWDLPPQCFSSGVTEDELVRILERKRYASKAGAEELWLVIAAGVHPCQCMGLPQAGILNDYTRCNAALADSPHDKVYLFEIMFDRVMCWQRSTGWQLFVEDF